MASTGNKAGGVALFGGGGLLTADGALTFDSASGTLAVTRLRASEVPRTFPNVFRSSRLALDPPYTDVQLVPPAAAMSNNSKIGPNRFFSGSRQC